MARRINTNKDFYKILGVSKSATQEEIKKAYYTLAKKYHPDFNSNDPVMAEKCKDVTEAYAVLGNNGSKLDYDSTYEDKTQQTKDDVNKYKEYYKENKKKKEPDFSDFTGGDFNPSGFKSKKVKRSWLEQYRDLNEEFIQNQGKHPSKHHRWYKFGIMKVCEIAFDIIEDMDEDTEDNNNEYYEKDDEDNNREYYEEDTDKRTRYRKAARDYQDDYIRYYWTKHHIRIYRSYGSESLYNDGYRWYTDGSGMHWSNKDWVNQQYDRKPSQEYNRKPLYYPFNSEKDFRKFVRKVIREESGKYKSEDDFIEAFMKRL